MAWGGGAAQATELMRPLEPARSPRSASNRRSLPGRGGASDDDGQDEAAGRRCARTRLHVDHVAGRAATALTGSSSAPAPVTKHPCLEAQGSRAGMIAAARSGLRVDSLRVCRGASGKKRRLTATPRCAGFNNCLRRATPRQGAPCPLPRGARVGWRPLASATNRIVVASPDELPGTLVAVRQPVSRPGGVFAGAGRHDGPPLTGALQDASFFQGGFRTPSYPGIDTANVLRAQ